MFAPPNNENGRAFLGRSCSGSTTICALLALWIGGFLASPAFSQGVRADALKATFLYRFASYVEWPPPSSTAPFTIGVVENDDVASQLEQLVPAISVNGQRVSLRRLRGGDSLDGVHVLYVGNSTSVLARVLRGAARSRPILVVADAPRALAEGAIINFLGPAPTLKFEVSLSNAERAGLRINARLLSVAARVQGRSTSSVSPGQSPVLPTTSTSSKQP